MTSRKLLRHFCSADFSSWGVLIFQFSLIHRPGEKGCRGNRVGLVNVDRNQMTGGMEDRELCPHLIIGQCSQRNLNTFQNDYVGMYYTYSI